MAKTPSDFHGIPIYDDEEPLFDEDEEEDEELPEWENWRPIL